MSEYVKDLRRIASGSGDLYMGSSMDDIFDRSRMTHVGFVEGGAGVQPIVEDHDSMGGRPNSLLKRQISTRGFTITFNFAESVTWEHWYTIIGEGRLETDNAAIVPKTNQQVVLHGTNIQKIPYRNFQITEIRTAGATPVIYSGLDLENNFEIDEELGTIQAKSTLTPQPDQYNGTLYYYSGTWQQPTTVSLFVGGDNSCEKRSVALLFLAYDDCVGEGYVIWKAYPQDIQEVPYRTGESRIAGITFRSAKDPTKTDEYVILNEQPA